MIKVISDDDFSALVPWLESRPDSSRILDVGGALRPLLCATHVIDLTPYEDRAALCHGTKIRFTPDTWTVADVCDGLPYDDQFFDFVWCSQVVEDVRDPVFLCREMQRVGNAGVISTVHWTTEANVLRDNRYTGFPHHRWMVDLRETQTDSSILTFAFKTPTLFMFPQARPVIRQPYLHLRWKYHFPVQEEHYSFQPDGTALDYLEWRKGNL